MLQNAYFLAKIGADTAENEQHFAEILLAAPAGAHRLLMALRSPRAAVIASAPPVAKPLVSQGARDDDR